MAGEAAGYAEAPVGRLNGRRGGVCQKGALAVLAPARPRLRDTDEGGKRPPSGPVRRLPRWAQRRRKWEGGSTRLGAGAQFPPRTPSTAPSPEGIGGRQWPRINNVNRHPM